MTQNERHPRRLRASSGACHIKYCNTAKVISGVTELELVDYFSSLIDRHTFEFNGFFLCLFLFLFLIEDISFFSQIKYIFKGKGIEDN